CWGGGGAGGVSGGLGGGGGGGGGAYAQTLVVPVTPGTFYTVTVGGQGAASSFTGDSGVTTVAAGGAAGGGTGGTGGAGGTTTASTGDVTHAGGTGSTGISGGGGGGGAGASSTATGASGGTVAGGGAGGVGGAGAGGGGAGGHGGDPETAGSVPGGGGGGNVNVSEGGVAGAAGSVLIEWNLPFIASLTALYTPALLSILPIPFIGSDTALYTPALASPTTDVDVPFIASVTRVFGVFSLYFDATGSGSGNGGELFLTELAPNGTTETATLAANITAGATMLTLTGYSGLPTVNPFCLTIDDEILYVIAVGGGVFRVRGRALGNTTAASHTAGASATWGDSYDQAITATVDIAHEFTGDITGSGSTTYPGWLLCFDSSQAYLSGDRYPMHVTLVVGVFDAGAGVTGTNRLDASQPNAIATATGTSDDCPAALSNPARISGDIAAGDVAVLRFTNPEASPLDLGPRSVALQSWFGMRRVDATDHDVTLTDPNGIVVDTTGGEGTFTGSANAEFDNPLGPGIAPDTGEPTSHDVPYTSVTLLGTNRLFTRGSGSGGYDERGWPIGVIAVRQGNRRIPFWRSFEWRDFNYVYSGFGTDDTFCQLVINRNGIVFGASPTVDLPGPQDIDGPEAVWDDGSYQFGVSWYVAIWAGPYLVIGPSIGGGVSVPDASVSGIVPVVSFPGGSFTPTVTAPPTIEGGSGGGIPAPTAQIQHYSATIV
ncbi:MAG TPA: hypothetical protein VG265_07220, partial [Gaiellaceae bacterium]|nr:hypothetical protein [Gaiellaceae bacterium]